MARRRCDPAEVIALNAQGLTQREIAERVGIQQCSVSELLKRHGVESFRKPGPVRRYAFNESYFETIETPDRAYWLGFMAADGYVLSNRQALGIGLAVCDEGHLDLFRAAVEAQMVPFRYIAPYRGGNGTCHLRLHSMRMVKDLIGHGIVPRKTEHCEPWDGPAHLMPHYWRGCIDGDGHVAASGQYVSFCGTLPMVEGFRSFAAGICGTSGAPKPNGKIWYLHIMGRRQVHAILTALYQDDVVGLARKKERALALVAEPYRPRTRPQCRVEGCLSLSVAKRLCGKHYQRWKSTGDPMGTRLDRGPDGRFRSLVA